MAEHIRYTPQFGLRCKLVFVIQPWKLSLGSNYLYIIWLQNFWLNSIVLKHCFSSYSDIVNNWLNQSWIFGLIHAHLFNHKEKIQMNVLVGSLCAKRKKPLFVCFTVSKKTSYSLKILPCLYFLCRRVVNIHSVCQGFSTLFYRAKMQ